MSLPTPNLTRGHEGLAPVGPTGAVGLMLFRNYLAYRQAWPLFLTGFLEPVFYLLAIGIGVGQMVEGFTFGGQTISYAAFVAPGMLAAAAMTGAILDSTFNCFFKLKYVKYYDQVLATPMTTGDVARGELAWCLLRGGIYATGFVAVMLAMGLIDSWWAVLVLPAALLIGAAFAAVGMALTTFMRSWQDFELVQLALLPMFLFSATFFPAAALGDTARAVVEVTPLYRGVVLCRELTTGALSSASLVSVCYLAVMAAVGLLVTRRRLDRLLLS